MRDADTMGGLLTRRPGHSRMWAFGLLAIGLWCCVSLFDACMARAASFEAPHLASQADRPPETWHLMGESYDSAYPAWTRTRKEAARGQWSITSDSDREFAVW